MIAKISGKPAQIVDVFAIAKIVDRLAETGNHILRFDTEIDVENGFA